MSKATAWLRVVFLCLVQGITPSRVDAVQLIHNESVTEGQWVRVKATGYCGCSICCGKYAANNRTSTGVRPVRFFTVAADYSVFPAGTILYVPGIGVVMVQDKGSAVKGAHLDVYHGREPQHHDEALRFGVRHIKVQVRHIPREKHVERREALR